MNLKKQLYYVTNTLIPANNAQSLQVIEMAKAFEAHLHENFLLVCPYVEGFSEASFLSRRPQIPFARNGKVRYVLFGLWAVFFLLKQNGKKVVYTRDVGIALLSALVGAKTFMEVHQGANTKFARLSFRFLAKFSHNTRLVCITESLKTYYQQKFGFKEAKLLVAHDGYNDEIYGKKLSSDEKRQELFGPHAGQIIVVHTGSVYQGRGFEVIEAFLEDERFHFYQIGGQERDLAIWKERFKDRKNLTFVGKVSRERVAEYQKTCDLLFYTITKQAPVHWCTSPLKLFEYMAAQTAVIAANVGSIGEILDEEIAYLFLPGSRESLKEAKDLFLKDLKSGKVRRAPEDYYEKYEWKKRTSYILRSLL